MELQGKVIVALPERTGVSSRGEWKSQDFVIETHESYPHKMVFSVFGAERLQRFNIQVGQEVMVSFDIDARQWNDRWFNSIRAWKVELPMQEPMAEIPQQAIPEPFPPAQPEAAATDESTDDLPF